MAYNVKKITVENFGPFKDRQDVPFDASQLNIVEGSYTDQPNQSNGSGKSMVLDALLVGLFGKSLRSVYLNDFIHDGNRSGGVYVGIELYDSTAQTTLLVERWRRPNQDVTKAAVTINNALATKGMTTTQCDALVETHIGVNFNNFCASLFTVMQPGFLKLTASKRFEILESSLALKKIDTVLKRVTTAIKTYTDRHLGLNKVLMEKTAEYAKKQAKLELYQENTDSLKAAITEHKLKIKAAFEAEDLTNARKQEAEELLKTASQKLVDVQGTITVERSKRESLIQTRQKAMSNMGMIDKGLTQQGSKLECVICHSSVTANAKDELKAHYKSEVDVIDAQIREIDDTIAGLIKKQKSYETSKDAVQQTIKSIEATLRTIYSTAMASETTIKQANESLRLIEECVVNNSITELKAEVDSLNTQIVDLQKDIEIYTGWKQALSKNGLRLSYIKNEVGTLSALASSYASLIVGHDTKISFFIANESDNPSLDFVVDGKNVGMFSTGEARRVELAITLSILSLLKTAGMNINTLVLDEATSGLSVQSRTRVLEIIKGLQKDHQVLMISHDIATTDLNGHVITVTKDREKEQSVITTALRSGM